MKAHFMTAGPPGYDDQDLHELSMGLGVHLGVQSIDKGVLQQKGWK